MQTLQTRTRQRQYSQMLRSSCDNLQIQVSGDQRTLNACVEHPMQCLHNVCKNVRPTDDAKNRHVCCNVEAVRCHRYGDSVSASPAILNVGTIAIVTHSPLAFGVCATQTKAEEGCLVVMCV